MHVSIERFGTGADGKEVFQYSVVNSGGYRARFVSYGAALRSFEAPDGFGRSAEITYGFDSLAEYEANRSFFGATIGRFANRIAGGCFHLDGRRYELARNNGAHHLHGGTRGFDRVVWESEALEEPQRAGVRFSHRSPDGEEGYPGTLEVQVVCSLSERNELVFEYSARTDRTTPVNLTNHTFWNLGGAAHATILDHELELNCPFYLPVDAGLVPTGEILKVDGTPMDFRVPKSVGRDIGDTVGGYDHCFVVGTGGFAAALIHPASRRRMEVFTDKPGLQFYSGNFLDDLPIAGGLRARRHGALCLETELFPDAPNRTHFPSCFLRPFETYVYTTTHRFSVF